MEEESAVSSRYKDDPSLTIPRSGTSSRSESKRSGVLELFPLRTINLKDKQVHRQVQIRKVLLWKCFKVLYTRCIKINKQDNYTFSKPTESENIVEFLIRTMAKPAKNQMSYKNIPHTINFFILLISRALNIAMWYTVVFIYSNICIHFRNPSKTTFF